jgi:hypothetical protein
MTEDGTDVEEKARALFEKFSDRLRRDWEDHTIPSNPTVRGSSYKEGLANFLRQYFGNKYIVSTNVYLIDNRLACFDVFTDGQNEFDVVATFSQAEPRISIESGDVQWIPLSSAAFLCEMKSKLTKPNLESNLEKLQSICQLAANPGDRFIGNVPGEYSTNRHILI